MDTIVNGEHYLKSELDARVSADTSLLAFIQAASPDGICFWDLENPEHRWMSPHFWQVLGYDPAKQPHLARVWQQLVDPEDLKLSDENFEQHFLDPKIPYDQITRYRHAQGHTVWVRCRGIIIRNAEGKAIRMLGAHTDLTAQERAKAALQARLTELVRSNEELEKLGSAICHDLREPLRKIVGFSQLIQQKYGERLDETGERWLNIVSDGGLRLERMLQGILSLSRVGGRDERSQPVDLNDLVAQQMRIYDGAEFVLPDPLPIVYGQPSEIDRLVQNLVSNAVKFNEADKARIEFSAERRGPVYELRIKDNGIGIPQADRERIFAMFQRLHRSDSYEGLGLGLTIVQKVVHNHGGEIRVESNADQGSTFIFSLPAVEGPEA